MSIFYYECQFQNQPNDTRLNIVIKSSRTLTELDALHVLYKHYNAHEKIYSASNIRLPPLGTFDGINRTGQNRSENDIVIIDGNDIPIEYNVIACPGTNNYPSGRRLELPAYMPVKCAESLLSDTAAIWAYENKMVRCTWANFLDIVTADFLSKYHIGEIKDPLVNAHPLTFTPKDHVKTQTVLIILRDENQALTNVYKCTLPNHIQTEQDVLSHFTKIAKALFRKTVAIPNEIQLNQLFTEMLKAANNDILTGFNTTVINVTANGALTFRNDRILELTEPS